MKDPQEKQFDGGVVGRGPELALAAGELVVIGAEVNKAFQG